MYFISHSTKDGADYASALVAALEAKGIDCWCAPRDVRPGQPYPRQIVAAIKCASALVALVTQGASQSADVSQEVQLAHRLGVRLLPIMFAGVKASDDLDYFFSIRQQIDWTNAKTVADRIDTSPPALLHPLAAELDFDALQSMPADAVCDGRTIAVVEDEALIRMMMVDVLIENGFRPLPFNNGLIACKALIERPVDLCILDINLPGMNGLDILARIRQSNDMPVIMHTSYVSPAQQKSGLQGGADDYIMKPYAPELLVERVRAVLRRASRVRPSKLGQDMFGRLALTADGCEWNGQRVRLTRAEARALTALVDERDMVVDKLPLAMAAWGEAPSNIERIDELMDVMRKRFKDIDSAFNAIERTRGGRGYKFVSERAL